MPRGELTDRARTVITVCAVAAVLYAAITPFFYRDLTYAFADVDSIPGLLFVRAIIVGVPNLLALAAVVLSGRPFVGVSIAVASAATLMCSELLSLVREGVPLGRDDWMSLIGTAVVLARVFDDVGLFLDGYWARQFAVDGAILVVVGLIAGAVAQRWGGVRQETAGLA
jgi:hypothetical protein